MTAAELAFEAQRLAAFARGLGLDDETVKRIQNEVSALAQTSPIRGTAEQRVAEIRRRMLEAAL